MKRKKALIYSRLSPNKWNESDKKETIIKELEEKGVTVDDLINSVDKKLDLFDLICHVAFDQPPLTRNERANNVRKRDYFTKYGKQARTITSIRFNVEKSKLSLI